MKMLFEKGYNAIAPCLRGYGYSSYNSPITSLKDLAEDVVMLVQEELGLKQKIFLMGCGIGSIITTYVANKLPD